MTTKCMTNKVFKGLAQDSLREANEMKDRFRYWADLLRNAHILGYKKFADDMYEAGYKKVLDKKVEADTLAGSLAKGSGSLTAKKAKKAWAWNMDLFKAHCSALPPEQKGRGRKYIMEISRADNFDYHTYKALESVRRFITHNTDRFNVQYSQDGRYYIINLFPRIRRGVESFHYQRQYIIPATYNVMTMFLTFTRYEHCFYGKANEEFVDGYYESREYPPALHTA